MQEQPQHYELTFIVSGNLAENEQPPILNQVKELLTKNGAQITQTVEMGRRKLAYAIKNLRHGFYFCWEFNLLPKNLEKIVQELKLNQNITRFLTIKKHLKTAAQISREEKLKAGRMRIELKKQQTEAEKERKPLRTAKPKISLEDLDKKLDELLDEKVI